MALPSRKEGIRCEARCGSGGGGGGGRPRRTQRAGEGSTAYLGEVRDERTTKISFMYMTLEVSKLSGWLNAIDHCRVEQRAYGAGQGAARKAVEAAGDGSARSVQGRARLQATG